MVYGFTGSTWQKLMEAIQGDLRKIGVDLKVQLFDATIAWGKMATQEFDMFGMSFPYISAGDALNLYFPSANAPTPNRMNWKDEQTDALLAKGMTALNDADRAAAYGEVLKKVHEAAVWLPLYHEPMKIAASARLAPFKAHNIYGCGLYKGLDLKFRSAGSAAMPPLPSWERVGQMRGRRACVVAACINIGERFCSLSLDPVGLSADPSTFSREGRREKHRLTPQYRHMPEPAMPITLIRNASWIVAYDAKARAMSICATATSPMMATASSMSAGATRARPMPPSTGAARW